MEVEGLFKQAVDEIERMLNTKTVVGEPLSIEGWLLRGAIREDDVPWPYGDSNLCQ